MEKNLKMTQSAVVYGVLALVVSILFLVPANRRWFKDYVYQRNHLCAINQCAEEAIGRADLDEALRYVELYEDLEKKKNIKSGEETTSYMGFYLLAYEAGGDYDKALEYYVESPATCDSGRWSPKTDVLDKARVLYKKGAKKEAFLAYCEAPPQIPQGEERRVYCEGEQSRILFKLNPRLENLSCFDTYAEFLAFLDEEYEKLGRPEEYADAVEKYHSLELIKDDEASVDGGEASS